MREEKGAAVPNDESKRRENGRIDEYFKWKNLFFWGGINNLSY